jgi:hypothetical protein
MKQESADFLVAELRSMERTLAGCLVAALHLQPLFRNFQILRDTQDRNSSCRIHTSHAQNSMLQIQYLSTCILKFLRKIHQERE